MANDKQMSREPTTLDELSKGSSTQEHLAHARRQSELARFHLYTTHLRCSSAGRLATKRYRLHRRRLARPPVRGLWMFRKGGCSTGRTSDSFLPPLAESHPVPVTPSQTPRTERPSPVPSGGRTF